MLLHPSPPNQIVKIQPARIGGAHRKYLLTDNTGREWLFKPQPDEQTLVDMAAAQVAQTAGVASPVVYGRKFVLNGQSYAGSLQPFLRNQIVQSELTRTLLELTQVQREPLQRHHVVDWLLANADPHRGQFLILHDGTLVAVDKSQALRFFPHDALRWDAHAWWVNRRPPVYGYLFQAVQAGHFTLDPDVAIDFANNLLTGVNGAWLRQTWHPFVVRWSPLRLFYATLNWSFSHRTSVDKVLNLMAQRKNNLGVDFRELYYHKSGGIW